MVLMYTRFTANSAQHILRQRGSMLPVPRGAPCSKFLEYVGSAYEKQKSFTRDELLHASQAILRYFQEQQDVLPYRYEYTIRLMGRDDLKTKGAGTTSGFEIDGENYTITGGNGECYLRRRVQNEEKTNLVWEVTDVRNRKSIETDEWGDIKISRRKINFAYPKRVEECVAFLESISSQIVELYSYDGSTTIRQILQEFSEGGGGADWALEEINDQGKQGKDKLLKSLANKRMQKYHDAAVSMLMICFPGDDTDSAIEDHLSRVPDEHRDELIILVAAFNAARKGQDSSSK